MSHSKKIRKTSWLPLIRSLHWMSSAICLVAVILFAFTGITLNHADSISASPKTQSIEKQLPDAQLQSLQSIDEGNHPVPDNILDWVENETGKSIPQKNAEWSEDEIYLGLPKPGGDAWLSIDRSTGVVTYEETNRGWIAYLNDLHKGRHTSEAWRWFLDFVSVCCLIFAFSGFWLLWRYSGNRKSTYPLLVIGVVAPWVILILSMH
jgi:uncharacterized protein